MIYIFLVFWIIRMPARFIWKDNCLGIYGTESCGNSLGTRDFPRDTGRTMWQIELELRTDAHQCPNDLMRTQQYIYLKQPDHEIDLGVCYSEVENCGNSKYRVVGYKKDLLFRFRCRWMFEVEGDHIYLKNLDWVTYLGMCDHITGCHGSKHGVHSYEEKYADNNKWEVEC